MALPPRSIQPKHTLALVVALGACATTPPTPAMEVDDVGRPAVSLFQAGLWREAYHPLRAFVRAHCLKARSAECDRAIGMLFQTGLKVNHPAQVVADYDSIRGPLLRLPDLNPSLKAVYEQAKQTVQSTWSGADRSAAIHVETVFVDSVGERTGLEQLEYSLEGGPVVSGINDGKVRALDFSVPAGSHLLRFSAHFRRGQYTFHLVSRAPFLVAPNEKARVTAVIGKPGTDEMSVDFRDLPSPLLP